MTRINLLTLSLVLLATTAHAGNLGSAFTYQGRLDRNGTPANGVFDFEFSLFDQATSGNRIGPVLKVNDLPVSDGVFTTELDFGPGAFNGDPRWLKIRVRRGSSTGNRTLLQPRQAITGVPYSFHAKSSSNASVAENSKMLEGAPRGQFLEKGSLSIETLGPNGNSNVGLTNLTGNQNHGAIGVRDADGQSKVTLLVNSDGAGVTSVRGPNGNLNVLLAGVSSVRPNDGGIGVADPNGDGRAALIVDDEGDGNLVLVNGNGGSTVLAGALSGGGFVWTLDSTGDLRAGLTVDPTSGQGIVFGDTKLFVVDHPKQPGAKIVYISMEGPEAAMFYRGKVALTEGRATIDIPEHFSVLAVAESITAQLTPGSPQSAGLAIASITGDRVEIVELHDGTGSYDVHFVIHATRRGYEDHKPVITAEQYRVKYGMAKAAIGGLDSFMQGGATQKARAPFDE